MLRSVFVADFHALTTKGEIKDPGSDVCLVECNGHNATGNFKIHPVRSVVGNHSALMTLESPNQSRNGTETTKERSDGCVLRL